MNLPDLYRREVEAVDEDREFLNRDHFSVVGHRFFPIVLITALVNYLVVFVNDDSNLWQKLLVNYACLVLTLEESEKHLAELIDLNQRLLVLNHFIQLLL